MDEWTKEEALIDMKQNLYEAEAELIQWTAKDVEAQATLIRVEHEIMMIELLNWSNVSGTDKARKSAIMDSIPLYAVLLKKRRDAELAASEAYRRHKLAQTLVKDIREAFMHF